MLRNRESDAATGGAKSEPVPLLQSPVVSDEIRCEKPQIPLSPPFGLIAQLVRALG